MTSVGTHSVDELIRTSPQQQLPVWQAGLAAILQVHQRGQNLSQAFARNIMWKDGKIYFIDFEDDPSKTLPLAYAQTRDWLLYLHSTAYQMQANTATLTSLWQQQLLLDHPEVQQLVQHCSQQLSFLRLLPRQRKPWGRDVVSLQGVGEILHKFKK